MMDFFLRIIERIMCSFNMHDWKQDIRSVDIDQRFCPTCRSVGRINRSTGEVKVLRRRPRR